MISNDHGQGQRVAGRGSHRGFSITEMIVTVGVIIALAALIMPGIRRMQLQAKQVQCTSNLRAIGSGFQRFLGENNNRYPGNGNSSKYFRWMYRVGPYMDLPGPITERTSEGETVETLDNAFNRPIFHCSMAKPAKYLPANAPLESVGVYGAQNKIILSALWGINANLVRHPSKTILLADRYAGGGTGTESGMGSHLYTTQTYPADKWSPSANHRPDANPAADPLGAGPCNFLFCDGHVESIDLKRLRPYIDRAGCPVNITFDPTK